MSESAPREFRTGLTWSFFPDQLESVLDAVARLPEEYRDACVFSTGSIEFDVEAQARSFDEAKQIVVEQVFRMVRDAGIPGQPIAASATDDLSWVSWRFVDGQFVAEQSPPQVS